MKVLLAFWWPDSSGIVERFGLVLLHSLWQFAFLALLASVIAKALRGSSTARYGVFSVAMALSVAAAAATWLLALAGTLNRESQAAISTVPHAPAFLPADRLPSNTEGSSKALNLDSAAASAMLEVPRGTSDRPSAPGWSEQAAVALRPWLAWIVAAWGAGVLLCSARPLLGWYTLRRLQRVGVLPTPDDVFSAAARISKRFGLNGTVNVWQSTLAQAPVVVGYLRPVVLLPVSLITGLPAAQLEAILAHEVAHIRRHDFVVNLLQTLVETVFFYHPAVWWLSRQIRIEREHCCDDLVVRLLGNPVEYGRALVAIEQLRCRNPLLALGATDGSLLARIRRIAGVTAEPCVSLRSRWSAALLGLSLVAVTCGMAIGVVTARDEGAKSDQPAVKPAGAASDGEVGLRAAAEARADEALAESTAEDILARKVSLTADSRPLKEALAALARAANLELQLEAEALKKVGLDVDQSVTTTIKDQPLADALSKLINWSGHFGAFREVRGQKLIITTLHARQEFIARHLPEWLQPHYNRGLLATLDDQNEIVSITAGEAVDDELLARLKTLPKLRELSIETTKRLTPAGLDAFESMASLEKLSFYSMRYEGQWLGDAIIERIVGLKMLRELSLVECGVTDEGVRRLEAMPQLSLLSLGNEGRLTDAALASIGKLKNLKSLSLSSYAGSEQLGRMKFSADGVRRLIGLQQLEELHLVGHAVPAEALEFARLKSLSLGHDEVDDACAARIATLQDLRSLVLVYTKITDDGLKNIAELPALARLQLDSRIITDAGIGHLKRLSAMQHISLRATHLTDASLRHLAGMNSLQRIDLNGSGEPGVNAGKCFSMRGIHELRALSKLRTLWLTNVAAGGGYESLKDLQQLRELTLMMTDIRPEEFTALEEALPGTRIGHTGSPVRPRMKRAPKPSADKKPAKAQAPAALPDIRLTGDEVTSEAIGKLADRAWGTVTLADARLDGAVIEGLRHVPSIRRLRLSGDGLSGQVPRLETVKGLIGLEIGGPLKGRDLEAIGRQTNLESLSLPQELTINVSGAREIAKLVQLKSLRLYNVNIDDASFIELRALVRLEELDLTHTRITDEGLTAVVRMPLLRTLELHRHPHWHMSQQLSDACLASIARLPELERLSLSGKVTDAGLKQVARWPKLKSLSIVSTEITGDGLAALADSSIEHLTLTSGQISEERVLEPLRKCPNLKSIMVIGQPTGEESKWPALLPKIDWSFSS
jgi:beta-lactamase regulating signal transducer with metallopeptidase domain/Leucine-rich repeat (LRR) protein